MTDAPRAEITSEQLAAWERLIQARDTPVSGLFRHMERLKADSDLAVISRTAFPALIRALRAAREPLRDAVVEAAVAHVDRPGEDGYRTLIDAVDAYLAARDTPP